MGLLDSRSCLVSVATIAPDALSDVKPGNPSQENNLWTGPVIRAERMDYWKYSIRGTSLP